ncbi:hypothetical protein H1P_620007 [Hyella patelloides LEGE 07179]|uniref:Uncharacterized protein n=1 Tax=Hyella patelloides LEGE 07179 TaxID=945734 RepID=A0A563W1C9_9CYAN|nr:hypothetical protein H1P_620007 [Hyella patelloides LEGE 07179]
MIFFYTQKAYLNKQYKLSQSAKQKVIYILLNISNSYLVLLRARKAIVIARTRFR